VRFVASLAALAAVAAAFALPSPGQQPLLKLTVERPRYEIVNPDRPPVAWFSVTPPPTGLERDSVRLCRNGSFDRQAVTELCSGHDFDSVEIGGRSGGNLRLAGRYEAIALRYRRGGPPVMQSNIVAFRAVDPCRLTVDAVRMTPPVPALRGEPIPCSSGLGSGRARLLGADGSRLTLAAPAGLSWHYERSYFRVPALQLYGNGRTVDIDYRLGARLGRLATVASISAGSFHHVSVGSTGRVAVSIASRAGTTRVRVRRGSVVAFRLSQDQLIGHLRRRCPTRPSLRCLAAIRYRIGRQVYAGRVLRAGGSAVFRRP
jgi:hypothetical protein